MHWPLMLRRVVGRSMEPILREGTIILVRCRVPQVGDIVMAWQNDREVVKRVQGLSVEGVFLVGDNRGASSDSRTYGPVRESDVLGVVIWPTKLIRPR